jgi:hypothetical protein
MYEGLVQLNEMETVFFVVVVVDAVENNDLVIWH